MSALRAPRLAPRAWVLPWLGAGVVAATVAFGLLSQAAGHKLGTALPPFVMKWKPELDPLLVISVIVLAGCVAGVPWLLVRLPTAPRWAIAAAIYLLTLGLGLGLNMARSGIHGYFSMFDSRHGNYEARFEYLTGLPALIHGIPYYVQNFGRLFPYLPTHAKGNPPGPLVALKLLGISRAGGLAWLCIGIGALSGPLAYDLGRVLSDERRGRVAGVLTAFTPSVLLFGVTSADYAFAAMGLGVACLLARRGWLWLTAGGALAGFVSFFSWFLLAIPAFSALLAWRRFGVRSAAGVVLACLAGIVAFDVLLWIVWRYDPFSALSATRHAYAGGIARTRPYAFWLFGSPVAWAVMLGPFVAWGLLAALADGDAAAVALVSLVAVAAVIGVTKAETERIWLPFVPLAAVAAASRLHEVSALRWALGVMAIQALVIECLFFTIW